MAGSGARSSCLHYALRAAPLLRGSILVLEYIRKTLGNNNLSTRTRPTTPASPVPVPDLPLPLVEIVHFGPFWYQCSRCFYSRPVFAGPPIALDHRSHFKLRSYRSPPAPLMFPPVCCDAYSSKVASLSACQTSRVKSSSPPTSSNLTPATSAFKLENVYHAA